MCVCVCLHYEKKKPNNCSEIKSKTRLKNTKKNSDPLSLSSSSSSSRFDMDIKQASKMLKHENKQLFLFHVSSSCGVNFFSVFFLVQSIYMASKHGFPSKKKH